MLRYVAMYNIFADTTLKKLYIMCAMYEYVWVDVCLLVPFHGIDRSKGKMKCVFFFCYTAILLKISNKWFDL